MRVLIVGSGGREHALAQGLLASNSVSAVWAAPGSDGIFADGVRKPATTGSGNPSDPSYIIACAREAAADLVVIGPEAPLSAGVADALREAGIAVFGPDQAGARLESSKAWAKQFLLRHAIPTAPAAVFDDVAAAESYVRQLPAPPVVKVDGLAAGKGVTVAADTNEAIAAVREALVDGKFGSAGQRVVIEERLDGQELSVLVVAAGGDYRILTPARDYKALLDGGEGPNTGGMGAYSPVPEVDGELLQRIERAVIAPTMRGLAAEGIDYRGIIYAGLMLTAGGPQVLEFNCRFGDPETQVIVPRYAGDWGELLAAAAGGRLPQGPLEWREHAAVCVVLAAPGYPSAPETGLTITGLAHAADLPDVKIFHAGTKYEHKRWQTNGGRVLAITGLGSNLTAARDRAYAACDLIDFPGKQYRTDIGLTAVGSRNERP